MIPILLSMVVIVALAGLVVAFVAYPHRGEDVPGASWLSRSMNKAVGALPTLDNTTREDDSLTEAERRGSSSRS